MSSIEVSLEVFSGMIGFTLTASHNDVRRKQLSLAKKIYKREEVYHNETARTYFLLSEVASAAGNDTKATRWKSRAEELRRKILGVQELAEGSESDYDDLIMFWSR